MAAVAALSGCLGPAAISLGEYVELIPITTPTGYADGTHRGSYSFALPPGAIAMSRDWTVEVTVSGGKIADIEPIEPAEFAVDDGLIPTLEARILESGSPRVDAVSGATVTSICYMKAVEDALLH